MHTTPSWLSGEEEEVGDKKGGRGGKGWGGEGKQGLDDIWKTQKLILKGLKEVKDGNVACMRNSMYVMRDGDVACM